MEENVKGSGSPDISTSLDVTQVMPRFYEGKAVESLSVEEAQAEWQEITLDKDDKYRNWPNSVRIGRQNKLWDHGFSEKIKQDQKAQEEKSREWLENENKRIADREEQEAKGEARRKAQTYFGEGKADAAFEMFEDVLNRVASDDDIQFLESKNLDMNPRIIEIIGNLDAHPELHEHVKKIGIKALLQIGSVALKRRSR